MDKSELERLVGLTNQPLFHEAAWYAFIGIVEKITDLDTLEKLAASIDMEGEATKSEEHSEELATFAPGALFWLGRHMAKIFIPEVLAAETLREKETVLGKTVKYFNRDLTATALGMEFSQRFDNAGHDETFPAIAYNVAAIAYAIKEYGAANWGGFLTYLEEE